jgi:nanoRNase/pAp phosphatase (c-di-AMP/oligoRNAs hydrolase)
MTEKFDELKKIIEQSEKILLINHIKMDNDAF